MLETHQRLPSIEEIHSFNDILYELGAVKVVGVRDMVVKYGDRVQVAEADSMNFVTNRTSIPIPKSLEPSITRVKYTYAWRELVGDVLMTFYQN